MQVDDVPIAVLYRQAVYPQNDRMIGKRFKIVHLVSDRGQTLNGKTCAVVSYDRNLGDCRLHCRIEGVSLRHNSDSIQSQFETLQAEPLISPMTD